MAARQRTSTGRKKIEIRLIESERARQVCFSKRRTGLFNMLTELSTLCGAEVAAVAFSPGGKAFSLGHPSVDSFLERVRNSNSSDAQALAAAADGGTGDRNQALAELNRELCELRAQLAAIKARTEDMDKSLAKARAEGSQAAWWLALEDDVSQMGDEDMAAFAAALEKVRADVAARAEQMLQEALLFGRPPVHGGGGGGDLEFDDTSASSGMEMTQAQQELLMMMLEIPTQTGLAVGTDMTQQQEMMMAMPPPTEFDAVTEMMQQQQMRTAMPPRTGFFAGTEMQQQQQQMPMMMAMPPLLPTGFDTGTELMQQQLMMSMPAEFAAGMETMQQQQQMMAMPPLPPLPGFSPGMETMQQQQMMAMPPLPGFGPGMETVHRCFP